MAAQDDIDTRLDNIFHIDSDESSLIQQSLYYDLDEFCVVMNNHNADENLSILNLNARSLVKNFNEFSAILEILPSSFDVITVEETWLSDSLVPLAQLQGYTFITKHKKRCKEGGGLGIYIKEGIEYTIRDDLECPSEFCDKFDYLFVEIKQKDPMKNRLIAVLYRAPGADSVNILANHLKTLLPKLNKENKNIALTSDSNINLLQCSNHKPTSFYFDTLVSNGFIPKITSPTRVTHSTATLIDHIFVNECRNKETLAGTITTCMSDHYFNFLFLKNVIKPERPRTVTYRAFTELNVTKFNEALTNTDFDIIFQSNDPNEAYDNLVSIYGDALNKIIPLKTVRFNKYKHSTKPWISKDILLSIKYRDKLHSKFKKAKSNSQKVKLEHDYNEYRSFLNKKIKMAKRNYDKEVFKKCKNDSKSIWKNINAILGKANNKKCIPTKINDENGISLSKLEDITNAFNNYYVNVGPKLATQIGPPNTDYRKNLPKIQTQGSLFLRRTEEQEVINIIKFLKPKSSYGHDGISPKFLKKTYAGIIAPIVYIINLSLSTGTVPNAMKQAKVVPIYKNSGSKEIMKNYRPVSLLPVISKVLERIVYNRLFEYLVKHKLLHTSQYGFQPGLSTELAILELQDRLNSALNNKECCAGVFMDLSKAFDTLDHKILLYKLNHYGIRGVAHDWFRNYLTGRSQYVCIDGVNSIRMPITCGVPQGSILGPLLFLIYINDLATVSKHAITILFADDTNTIYKSNSYENLKHLVTKDLQNISDWFKANKLALNETKTKFVIFHKSRNKPPKDFKLILNNIEIERVEVTKFLGVLIHENLSWKPHVDYVSNKVSKATALLAKLKHYLPKYVLAIIYNSLCLSHISYALLVWGSAPKSCMSRLTKLQKKGIRHICHSKYNAHTHPLFKKERILQIGDLFKTQCAKIMCKKIQNKLHHYHSSKLTMNYEKQTIVTRQRFDVQMSSNEDNNNLSRINSINYKVGTNWNKLPFNSKMLAFKTIPTFVKHIKNLYLATYTDVCNIKDCYSCK